MILSAQTIRRMGIIRPFSERTTTQTGLTYGLSAAGYDVRVEFDATGRAEYLDLLPGQMMLASTLEAFVMPENALGIVHDKSSLARKGLALQNTVIEPGWFGHLTLEISYHSHVGRYRLIKGQPIAQIVFHLLDQETEQPYNGKYQGQLRGPQEAL